MRFSHRNLDPRAKLVFASAIALVAIIIPELSSLGALAILLVGWIAIGRDFGVREWGGSLAPFKIIVPIIFLLNAWFYGGGTVLVGVTLGGIPITITTGGLHTSTIIAARLLVIAGAASWFAATTDPELFEAALVRLGVPWGFAFLCSLTLRLVPELRDRFRTIEEAQRARGLTLSGGPFRRAKARLPMLIPFLVSVVNYGYELSDALTVRDYGRSPNRTSVIQLSHHRADYALYAAAIALCASFIVVFG